MSSKIHLNQQVLEKLESLLEGLEFGTVQITVHDSQITQIDRLERHRLPLQKKTTQVANNRKNER
ncbi:MULTISPECIES: YezD family protein [Neobacillus]|uniref:YezD family protein n=1 Tax=Neobacillus rhizophilus TaxID=2833579 RepID=A0A942U996_9BACI|nr:MULTISPECIES: YezD family protein [Neobacillus]MBS4213859.1 YezD family protein [Neobacillus rhizophilus]MBU8917737.1 YezD family protein [Bacillus sp. FJAT-29953]